METWKHLVNHINLIQNKKKMKRKRKKNKRKEKKRKEKKSILLKKFNRIYEPMGRKKSHNRVRNLQRK